MNDATLFVVQLSARDIPTESFCGRTFTGIAAIIRDDAELVEAIRVTTVPVGFESFPRGGWLLYPKDQGGRAADETEAADGTAVVVVHGEPARPTGS